MDLDLDGLLQWRCIGPSAAAGWWPWPAAIATRNTFYFGAVAGGVWKTTDARHLLANPCPMASSTPPRSARWRWRRPTRTSSTPAPAKRPSASTSPTATASTSSTDAGRTWTHVGLRDTRHIGKIRVHPHEPGHRLCGGVGPRLRPQRGARRVQERRWRRELAARCSSSATRPARSTSASTRTNPRILYATIWEAHRTFWQISSGGPDSGLWRSRPMAARPGRTSPTSPACPTASLGKIGVAASPAQAGRVWALIEHATEGGLYRSDDFGEHWEKVSDNQNLVSRAWYYMHLTADPQDADTVYVNNLELLEITDGGKTFAEIATPHGDNHDLWIDPRTTGA